MTKSYVNLDTVHIRHNFIMLENNTYYTICESFDGFDYISDG